MKDTNLDRADRVQYATGALLLNVAGLMFYVFFLDAAIRHNNYLAFALLLPCLLMISIYLGRRLRVFRGARYARVILFALTVFVSGLVVSAMDVPINVISMRIEAVFASTHFLMEPPGTTSRRDRLSEFMRRGDPEATVTFFLRRPIRRKKKAPFRMTIRGQSSVDIARLSFGSSVLFGWLRLAQFQGSDILHVAGVYSDIDSLRIVEKRVRLTNRLGSKPRFYIVSDEGLVKNHIPRVQIYKIKAVWFFIYIGIATLTIWARIVATFLSPAGRALANYFSE